jgi:hypothetical protein
MMNETWSQLAANGVITAACGIETAFRELASAMQDPSVLFRPALSLDGDMWCALYGDNLQDGVAGFGKSPADALMDFNRKWFTKLPETLR